MRPIFTDYWNSFWHFVLGIIAYYIPVLILPFLTYQYILKPDVNSTIDTFEFAIGFMIVMIIKNICKK